MATDSTSNLDEQRRAQLALLRRRAGFSQAGLADHLGVSRSSTSRWERGLVVPNPSQLVDWAAAIGISVAQLDDLLWSGDTSVRFLESAEISVEADTAPEGTRDLDDDGHQLRTDVAATASLDVRPDVISPPGFDDRGGDLADAIRAVLGLDAELPNGDGVRAAVALSSFSGRSIQHGLASDDAHGLPPAFVQGEDDIANDLFFGKRDVQLANRLAAAMGAVGFNHPVFIEDRAVWDNLRDSGEPLVPTLRLLQDDDELDLDVLVVVGLWSHLLATGLAGWDALPEFQMVGDPREHATRTLRICTGEGLRIVDLNASVEAEELGGNPALILTRRLADVHLIVAGGANSLGTLRLAELLANRRVWVELAYTLELQRGHDGGGTWFAIECPNAAQWRDRCRIVGAGVMDKPLDQSIRDLAHVDWTTAR